MSQEIKIYKPQIKVYYRANNVEEWLITEETKEPLIRAVMAKNGVIILNGITIRGSSIRRIEKYNFSVLGSLDEFIDMQYPGITRMLRKERENFSTFTTKTSAIERLLYKFKVPIQDIIADPQEIDSVIMAHDLWVKEGNPVLFHELNKTKYLEIMRIAF